MAPALEPLDLSHRSLEASLNRPIPSKSLNNSGQRSQAKSKLSKFPGNPQCCQAKCCRAMALSAGLNISHLLGEQQEELKSLLKGAGGGGQS